MQTTLTPATRKKSAYILLLILFFLSASLLVFGGLWHWSSSSSIQTARNVQFVSSQAAAEAATENVLATMMRDYLSQSLTNASYYQTLLPNQSLNNAAWPVQFVFSDNNSVTNQISVIFGTPATYTVPLTSQFTGLYGLVQNVTLTATATPVGQPYTVPATISEGLQFASIPIFQFAIFYNINLEIDPGAAMLITGPVFSNSSIWAGTPNLTFSASVSAVGVVNTTGTDPFMTGKTDSGNPHFSMAGQPNSGVTALKMPVGTNNNPSAVQSILALPPAAYALGTTAAYTTNGQIYLANGADIVVTNAANGTNFGTLTPVGTNFLAYFQDQSLAPISFDFFILTNKSTQHVSVTNYATAFQLTNILNFNLSTLTNPIIYAGYSFLTNVLFYDWREGWSTSATKGKPVQAVQIDIANFNKWLTNSAATNNGVAFNSQNVLHKAHGINSIYVYNGVPATSTTLPAVRLINGQQLTSAGLGVATPFPMYVKGNFNVTGSSGTRANTNATGNYTYPAALYADAVTILSSNWNDTTTSKLPTPVATTINAACLEGIVPSINSTYSGGVENFLRLLENWSSSTALTYNGSIVVMFPSIYATNSWLNTGNYYNAPKRNWAFDLNFAQQSGLPPLTPQIKAVIRSQWFGQ